MNKNKIFQDIELAIRKDKKEMPDYPDHICAMANKVSIKAGKLAASSDDWKYNHNNNAAVAEKQMEWLYEDAINVAAQAIRFIEKLKN